MDMLDITTTAPLAPSPISLPPVVPIQRIVPRDIISISREARETGPGLSAIDSRIAQAESDLEELQVSIRQAISGGDPDLVGRLSLRTGQTMAVLVSLGETFLDEERYAQVDSLLTLGRRLKTLINSAEAPLGRVSDS
jgi:hypothetical protein